MYVFRWDNYDKQLDDEWHVLMSVILISITVFIGWVFFFHSSLEMHLKIHL